MEYAIGEIVILPDGRKAEVVEEDKYTCYGCIYDHKSCIDYRINGVISHCDEYMRSDHKSIIYKEIK